MVREFKYDFYFIFIELLMVMQNALLEFEKVVTAKQQVVSGTLYTITLEAKDGGQKKVYEAKVWEKAWLNFKEVQEFKLVGDAPA